MIDRLVGTFTDQRLVAHLCADEPAQNARIVSSLYLADEHGRHCRPLAPQDFATAPFIPPVMQTATEPEGITGASRSELVDRHGRVYRLGLTRNGRSIPELRWHRHPPHGERGRPEPVTVREAIGSLERYEPMRTLTARALEVHLPDPAVSVAVLRAELERLYASSAVLNRGVRKAVLTAIERDGLTTSEIAIRCGRLKRNGGGNEGGDTSWLCRRIGILPEGGQIAPTPWVSSDALALIARSGLGVAPRELELG